MVRRRNKATSAIMAGLLAVGMAASPLAPVVALAANEATVGAQTSSGQTDLTMIMRNTGEHGGTAEPEKIDNPDFDPEQPESETNPRQIDNPLYNPDADGDGYGDNLAFSVPTSINYVVDADGSMTGPTNAAIQNHSVMGINVSSVDVDEETPFKIVSDATVSTDANSVDLQFGPAEDQLNAADYLTKADVADATKWEMGAEGAADANLGIETDGHVSHVAQDITQQRKFGTIKWYLKATHQETAPSYGTVVDSWDVGFATGSGLMATLYDSGTLVISGVGAMMDFNYGAQASPWAGSSDVTSVVVEDGITYIGHMAFADCSNLTSVTIPSSVTSIESEAVMSCPSLTTINCGFAENAVSGAPWGAENATINYNYAG